MSARKAIEIMKKTGNLTEAVTEALSNSRAHDLSEQGTGQQSDSQVFFAPNQDALNQLLLRVEDKLPDCSYSVDEVDGPPPGWEVTVKGELHAHDVASLAAVKGVVRIDAPNQELQ